MIPARTNERGFTMIEVMVSLLLTAIAVMGVIALFLSETQQSSFSRHNAEAAVLANDRLERLRTTAVATGTITETGLDSQGNPGGIFERRSVISQGTDTTYSSVQVSVGWDEDEKTTTTCTTATEKTACRTEFCLSSGACADRAVVIAGRRIN